MQKAVFRIAKHGLLATAWQSTDCQTCSFHDTYEPDKLDKPIAPTLQSHAKLPPFGRVGVGVRFFVVAVPSGITSPPSWSSLRSSR